MLYISNSDEKLIHDHICNVLYTHDVNVPHILRFWKEAKQDLYSLFGNQLILSKEVVVPVNKDEIRQQVNYLCAVSTFYNRLPFEVYQLFTRNGLAENRYKGETTLELTTPSGKIIKAEPNCRLSKVLRKVAQEWNVPGYEPFRIDLSRILDANQGSGTLCLSIHPLDYITMSDNNDSWSSCMSWLDEGCFRQGTVEMMNSPFVVVAYLKSKKNMQIGEGTWNSKRWRCLYVVTPKVITSVRQYPYTCDELDNEVLKWLRQLAQETGFSEFPEEPVEILEDRTPQNTYIHFHTNFMYNDWYQTRIHTAFLKEDLPSSLSINYSGASECMSCGEEILFRRDDVGDDFAASLCCLSCTDNYARCEGCGGIYLADDMYYHSGTEAMYCCDCYDNLSYEEEEEAEDW